CWRDSTEIGKFLEPLECFVGDEQFGSEEVCFDNLGPLEKHWSCDQVAFAVHIAILHPANGSAVQPRAPFSARLRDAQRRAKARRGSAGPLNGRASAATAS